MTKKEQNEMVACLPEGIAKSTSLTETQKKVLAAIYSKRHTEQYTANGFWFINNEELAKEAGLDPKSGTLRYTLSRLIDLNLINRKPGLHGRRGVSSEYSINEEGIKQMIEQSEKSTKMKTKRQQPTDGKNTIELEEKIEKLTLRIEQFFNEIKEQNNKNTALLTALLNRLSDSELDKGSKRADKRAVSAVTLPSDTDTESETEKKLIPNVLVTGTHERNEVLVSSSFEENTPDGNGTSPVTEGKSDSVEAILTLSGDEASAGQHSSQSGNSSDETSMTSDRDNLNDSEDVTFDELLLNPMQPSGGNTTVTATETYPQSGEKRIDKTPAAAPRAPQKKEMPSDAQKRPTGDVIQFDGTTIRQEGKTRSETKREPSLEEYLRERGKEERELLEELDSHRTFGTRDVSENIRKFYVQLDMLYQYKPTAGMDTLETIYRRAENLLGKEFDRLGGKDMTQAQKDMLAKKYEHLDRIWDGKQKYLEKMNEQDTEETPSEAPKEYVMDEPTTTAVMELPTRTRHHGRKNASWRA